MIAGLKCGLYNFLWPTIDQSDSTGFSAFFRALPLITAKLLAALLFQGYLKNADDAAPGYFRFSTARILLVGCGLQVVVPLPHLIHRHNYGFGSTQ